MPPEATLHAMVTRSQAISTLTAAGEPYALETRQVRGGLQKVFVNAPATLRDLYDDSVSDKEFLVYRDERLTFAETHRLADRIAYLLVNRFGVGKGDRVAIAMRNYPEWVLAFQAATSIGAIAVALNAHWRPEEMNYGLKNSGAKVMFADRERLEHFVHCDLGNVTRVLAVRSPDPGTRSEDLQTLLAGIGDVPTPSAFIDPDDDAIIFYTSGSTGFPKGVVSSHRNLISALFSWELDARANALVLGAEIPESVEQPATLLGVPLFHVTGSHAVYLQSYRAQRRMVCMYKWDPEHAAELIERERISTFTGPAAMTGDLVRVAHKTDRDLSSLAIIGGGGAPRAPEQVKQIDASFVKASPVTGWGMTETNGIGAGIGGTDYLARPASSGRCSAVMVLSVVDEQGRTLGPGERGELLVRGTALFRGYWNRDDLNATLFEHGWFRTGDVAYLDDHGYLFIVDRIKDLIIRGGENIGCGHVEAALLAHPHIHEAAVYAVPDERLGEEVGATVHGDPGLNPDEIREHLGAHLAKFEIPRFVQISLEPLPRTASGKVFKRQLRDEAVARLVLPRHGARSGSQ